MPNTENQINNTVIARNKAIFRKEDIDRAAEALCMAAAKATDNNRNPVHIGATPQWAFEIVYKALNELANG